MLILQKDIAISNTMPYPQWSPTGKARGISMKYLPTPTGAETLRCDSTKASAGYPPVAESAVALTQGHMDDLATEFAFIHGQSPCLHAEVLLQNIWQERVSARRRGLLRRRINSEQKYLKRPG